MKKQHKRFYLKDRCTRINDNNIHFVSSHHQNHNYQEDKIANHFCLTIPCLSLLNFIGISALSCSLASLLWFPLPIGVSGCILGVFVYKQGKYMLGLCAIIIGILSIAIRVMAM